MDSKPNKKIDVKYTTWKRLTHIKLNEELNTLDEVIQYLLRLFK